jgi:YesN/AraC family two-component response regulator
MAVPHSTAYTLTNPTDGNLAFKVFWFDTNAPFDHVQRLNYYCLIVVQQGQGRVKADFAVHSFGPDTLLSFAPYQPFMVQAEDELRGYAIQFHPDFFCIHKHHREVACNGVLFNNIYEPPLLKLDAGERETFDRLAEHLRDEVQHKALAQYELLISYLKIVLVTASRIKARQSSESSADPAAEVPSRLQELRAAIERHYRQKHSASDYADLLNVTPKALAKITRQHYHKTLTDLIAERIVIEAKRELYLTAKPVKAIAYELGFDDEYYFSRFFKKNTDVSPQLFRQTVGFARADS